MELLFLGTGSAFTIGEDNYQSNMVITGNSGEKMLIDCGDDARHSLFDQHFSHENIDALYVSHLHSDHVGGIEWLAFRTMFTEGCKRPVLYISEKIKNSLWNNVLKGGLSSLENEQAKLTDFFEVKPLKEEGEFTWGGINFQQFVTLHAKCGKEYVPSYGLNLTEGKHNILLTLDTQFHPDRFLEDYKKATIIFHDCEVLKRRTNVHAHYDDLKTLDPKIKSKMWLYDYNPGTLPNAKKDGFKGFVRKGQKFIF